MVGSGNRTQFWTDKWALNIRIKDEFPRLFSSSVDKEGSLMMFYNRRGESRDWNFSFRRPLLGWEKEEVGRLQDLFIEAPAPWENCPDVLRWNASSFVQFTVASVGK